MKVKTSELTGVALDWAVATAEGWQEWDAWEPWENGGFFAKDGDFSYALFINNYRPSLDWSQGGPLIERERITTAPDSEGWAAYFGDNLFEEDDSACWQLGPTPLVAAMRCFVASKLGDEIEIPEELL